MSLFEHLNKILYSWITLPFGLTVGDSQASEARIEGCRILYSDSQAPEARIEGCRISYSEEVQTLGF